MKKIDMRKSDTIVCYDKAGMLSAPRAYWMLRNFGAPNVYLLNGAYKKWEDEGKPVDHGDS
jgi:thiosulfate/3-mercaptopyruvate sulfurtransferase